MNRRTFIQAMLAAPALLALPSSVGAKLALPPYYIHYIPPPSSLKITNQYFFSEVSGVQHRLDVYSADFLIKDVLVHFEGESMRHIWKRGSLPHASFSYSGECGKQVINVDIRGTIYSNVQLADPAYIDKHQVVAVSSGVHKIR